MDEILQTKQYIFGSIFLLSNKIQIFGDKITDELTLKQWLLLNMLTHHIKIKPNFNDIAKAVGVTRQNVIKMIHILEKKEFVELHESHEDHRSIEVSLTPKTQKYFHKKQSIGNDFLNILFENLSSDELIILKSSFSKIQHNILKLSKEEEHG